MPPASPPPVRRWTSPRPLRSQPLHLLPPSIAQPFSIRPCQLLRSSFYSTKLFLWPHPIHQIAPGAAGNVPPGALLQGNHAKVIKKYHRFRIRRSGNPVNLPNLFSSDISYTKNPLYSFISRGPTAQQSGARRAFRARARRSARSVAAGGRIFRLRCRRSANYQQTTSVFGPSVPEVCGF